MVPPDNLSSVDAFKSISHTSKKQQIGGGGVSSRISPISFTPVAKRRTWTRRICEGKLSFVVRDGTAWSQCGGA